MSFFGLFGPPNIEKLKAKRDVQGLIKALNYQRDARVQQAAAQTLAEIADVQAVDSLVSILKSDYRGDRPASGDQQDAEYELRIAVETALQKILERHAHEFSVDKLQMVVDLEKVFFGWAQLHYENSWCLGKSYSYHERMERECSSLRQLARQELIRRQAGTQAAVSAPPSPVKPTPPTLANINVSRPLVVADDKKAQPSSSSSSPPSEAQADSWAMVSVLVLRNLVIYPDMTIPLTIIRPHDIALVNDAMAGNRLLILVAAKESSPQVAGADAVYLIGTIASPLRSLRTPDNGIRVLIQTLKRVRIEAFTQTTPYPKANAVFIAESIEDSIEVEALTRLAIDQFARLPDVPTALRNLVLVSLKVETPLATVYQIAANSGLELHDAQKLLELDSTEAKLRHLNAILSKKRPETS